MLFGIDTVRFSLDLLAFYGLYVAISLSVNLEFGYTGIPNFGKVLYVAGGAAFAGAFSGRFAAWILGIPGDFLDQNFLIINKISTVLQTNLGLSLTVLLLALLVAAGIGAFLGFITTYPALRLREDYLAMLLLGSAQFFQIFLGNYTPLINGSFGVEVPDVYAWAGDYRFMAATGALLVLAAIVYFYSERIARSPLGRTLRAVRDNDSAAAAVGKDRVLIRRNVLIIASIISAIAGALYTFYTGDVNAATYGRVVWTFYPWVMVILGGAANNFGVAVGVFAFVFSQKVLEVSRVSLAQLIPFDVNWLEYLAFGTLLVAILLFRSEGIIREKPTFTLSKRKLSEIMASYSAAPLIPPKRSWIRKLIRRLGRPPQQG
jgi:branched-chain amino acid transport system permease protein